MTGGILEALVGHGPSGRRALRAAAVAQRCRTGGQPVVGALRVDVRDLDALAPLAAAGGGTPLAITVVVPGPAWLGEAAASARAMPGVRLEGLAVALAPSADLGRFVGRVARECASLRVPWAVSVAAPALPGGGGSSARLAAELAALVAAGVPLEVTGVDDAIADAGALPGTERTGVLNLLLAVAALRDGAEPDEVEQLLAVAHPGVVEAVHLLDSTVRHSLRAVVTARIDDVLTDLAELGLPTTVGWGAVVG